MLSFLQYDFFINALIAIALCSIIAGFIGTYIVARKIVFVSGGITHASFGGIGIAFYLGLSPFLGAFVFALLTGLGIEWSSRKAGVREDSAIAILWSLGMALGIIFIFITPGYTPNLMSFLFGSVLLVTHHDIIWMTILAGLSIISFILLYRSILYTAFDEEFSQASGIKVALVKYLMMVLVAAALVLCIRVVGVILVLSIFTIPQATANQFTSDFKKIIIYSFIIGFIGCLVGLVFSYYLNFPTGATIIFSLTLFFGIAKLIKYLFVR